MTANTKKFSGPISDLVTIVMPAFNEEAAIGKTLDKINGLQESQRLNLCECIVVDDGSTDKTGLEASSRGVQVIRHPYNKGYGAAIKTGVRASTGDVVVIIDADGQHDPEDIPRLLEQLDLYDMVAGQRTGQQGVPYWRRPGKVLLRWILTYLINRKLVDFNCGFRVFRKSYLESILSLMPDGYSFSTTSTICGLRQGLSVGFLSIHCEERKGKSYVSVVDGFRTLFLIIRLGILFSPLRAFSPIVAALGLVGCYFVVYSYLVEGHASLKGIMVILAAVITFLFSLLIDQVSAIRRGEVVAEHQGRN